LYFYIFLHVYFCKGQKKNNSHFWWNYLLSIKVIN
jgi:hypothetical protein